MDIPDGDIAVATARHETLSIGSEFSRAAPVVGDLQAADHSAACRLQHLNNDPTQGGQTIAGPRQHQSLEILSVRECPDEIASSNVPCPNLPVGGGGEGLVAFLVEGDVPDSGAVSERRCQRSPVGGRPYPRGSVLARRCHPLSFCVECREQDVSVMGEGRALREAGDDAPDSSGVVGTGRYHEPAVRAERRMVDCTLVCPETDQLGRVVQDRLDPDAVWCLITFLHFERLDEPWQCPYRIGPVDKFVASADEGLHELLARLTPCRLRPEVLGRRGGEAHHQCRCNGCTCAKQQLVAMDRLRQAIAKPRRTRRHRLVVEVPSDVRRQLRRGLVTARAVLLERLEHDPVEVAAQLARQAHGVCAAPDRHVRSRWRPESSAARWASAAPPPG